MFCWSSEQRVSLTGESNIVVSRAKIHNDSNVDISQDGQFLCAFVQNSRSFSGDITLGVFSLRPSSLGDCLYSKIFGKTTINLFDQFICLYSKIFGTTTINLFVFIQRSSVRQPSIYLSLFKDLWYDNHQFICLYQDLWYDNHQFICLYSKIFGTTAINLFVFIPRSWVRQPSFVLIQRSLVRQRSIYLSLFKDLWYNNHQFICLYSKILGRTTINLFVFFQRSMVQQPSIYLSLYKDLQYDSHQFICLFIQRSSIWQPWIFIVHKVSFIEYLTSVSSVFL